MCVHFCLWKFHFESTSYIGLVCHVYLYNLYNFIVRDGMRNFGWSKGCWRSGVFNPSFMLGIYMIKVFCQTCCFSLDATVGCKMPFELYYGGEGCVWE